MKLIDPSLQLTKGYRRALLFQPVRKKIHLVPNSMADLILTHRYFDMDRLKQEYQGMDDILLEYEGFLLEHNYLLDASLPFTPVPTEWLSPYVISTSIVEMAPGNAGIFREAVTQLSALGCHTLEIRAIAPIEFQYLAESMTCIDQSRIKSVLLVLPFHPSFTLERLEHLVNVHLRISSVILSGASRDQRHEFHNGATTILFSGKSFHPVQSCGVIKINNFDFDKFREAKTHNSCLNRKISVLSDGTIKNCPSMKASFGHITDRSLKEVLANPDFLFYWTITKDQVKKCRDCEFRHFCYDCRAFLEDPEDIYSKPLKCGYDPYEGKFDN